MFMISVKLPKNRVPTLDGNILNWSRFWDRFKAAIDSRDHLPQTKKLVYLRHAVKDGPAKMVIEGLSQSAETYTVRIDCLHKSYDSPRLVHQVHIHAIIEAHSLRDNTRKELRRLHDVTNQHLRALKKH